MISQNLHKMHCSKKQMIKIITNSLIYKLRLQSFREKKVWLPAKGENFVAKMSGNKFF